MGHRRPAPNDAPSRLLVTPERRARDRRRREREEQEWASKNGPVEVRIAPGTGCENCGNDDATVVISNGQKVCTDCAEVLDP